MDIEGLGQKAMEHLMTEGLINDIPDIYSLKEEQLASLDGWGEISAKKAVEAIAAGRNVSLGTFI